MSKIYLEGIGGLGNCLYQIAAAIYYCEKYNYHLILKFTNSLIFGTSIGFGRNKCYQSSDGNFLGYDRTLFNKLEFTHNIPEHCIHIHNDYTNNKLEVLDGKDLLITGYNQNINLFMDYIDKIPNYIQLKYDDITNYITNKYGDISKSICLGVRIGNDFSHMKNITLNSYLKALNFYKKINVNTDKIFILSDTENIHEKGFEINKYYNCIEVNEKDIVQFYFGLMCKNYILSESTFHVWIAYLGTLTDNEKQVIYFNNTDISNRNLNLQNWIRLDC